MAAAAAATSRPRSPCPKSTAASHHPLGPPRSMRSSSYGRGATSQPIPKHDQSAREGERAPARAGTSSRATPATRFLFTTKPARARGAKRVTLRPRSTSQSRRSAPTHPRLPRPLPRALGTSSPNHNAERVRPLPHSTHAHGQGASPQGKGAAAAKVPSRPEPPSPREGGAPVVLGAGGVSFSSLPSAPEEAGLKSSRVRFRLR